LKILVIGSDKIFAIENFYCKYLSEVGVNMSRFLAPNFFNDYYQKGIINRIFFRVGISPIYRMINDKLCESVLGERPDIIWVFKGMEIYPSTLKWIKSQGIKLVNYNPDNPFIFSGRGSGNRNITESIGLYDLHFTYNLEIQKKLREKFNVKTCVLPFGFDLSDELFNHCASQVEIEEVCFVGNPDIYRAKFITNLGNGGISINVYGHNWGKFVSHSRITIHEAVYGDTQWEVLRKYRVQLNLMRPHNENSHNMRTFEVPGVGGILLAPDTQDHKAFFNPNYEIFLFTNQQDCIQKINLILKLPKANADAIRLAARKRCIESGYYYQARSKEVLNALQKL
jgi:spore maturation protein CgeB